MPRTVIVTDSTASLPEEITEARGIVVVPLQVVIGATSYDEGVGGATPELVAEALREFRPVSTSRSTDRTACASSAGTTRASSGW